MSKAQEDAERDEAFRLSQNCPLCSGCGLVTVYLSQHKGSGIATSRDGTRYMTRCAANCGCECGVWMRSHNNPEIQRRTPFVPDMLENRSRVGWQLDDPTENMKPMEPSRRSSRTVKEATS